MCRPEVVLIVPRLMLGEADDASRNCGFRLRGGRGGNINSPRGPAGGWDDVPSHGGLNHASPRNAPRPLDEMATTHAADGRIGLAARLVDHWAPAAAAAGTPISTR